MQNVLTFIKKAATQTGSTYLEARYDGLCDAVRPSIGANEIFDNEYGISPDTVAIQMSFPIDPVERSELTSTVRISAGRAL
jgi:hypothetical protein